MTTVILVRHGQTAWNVNERFRGREDVPLDETGLDQAECTARRIAAQWSPVAVYCSPLSRARVTAEAVARQCGLQVEMHHGLIDIDYGKWQGMTPAEARQRYPRRIRRWYRGSRWIRPPGGELLAAVQRRCLNAVLEIASAHPGKAAVAVGHTVVNRLILLGALSVGLRHFWHLGQEPCAVNLIEVEGRSFILRTMNDTCHLQSAVLH
jgi:probable phosphoglycerate mutase